MPSGHVHAQRGGPYAEAKRRLERNRFAVDACGDRSVRVDFELGGRPLTPRSLRQSTVAATGDGARDRDTQ